MATSCTASRQCRLPRNPLAAAPAPRRRCVARAGMRQAGHHADRVATADVLASDGTSFAASDTALLTHADHLRLRRRALANTLTSIESEVGSLEAFALNVASECGLSADRTRVREWVPVAARVWLAGTFNDWREDVPLTLESGGWWSATLPSPLPHGTRYRLRIETRSGARRDAASPWATWSVPADTSAMGSRYDSAVWAPDRPYQWQHAPPPPPRTYRIYEAHVGMASEAPAVATYTEFARDVLPRIAADGYNAVQLMAVAEHTYYGSFGYQVTSPFAVASRSGTPDDFKALVDTAHSLGLRVLLDIVHSHASASVVDGLAGIEGDEHEAQAQCASYLAGHHPEWGSRLFAYDRWETLRLLLANLAWWMTEYRVDGFRFDGVTSMLYRHHGCGVGFSGNYGEYFSPATNVDAAVYLSLANLLIKRLRPDAVSIAEDVSGAPGVARAVADGGLGFDARLSMGLPDLWARLGSSDDAAWRPDTIISALCNRRRDEAAVAYVESHDQCLVGDTTLAWRLMGGAMYDGMSATSDPPPPVARGVALHKVARALTLALGGDAWLNFMGNEFGHPEWVDFPRDGNGWSHAHARRQWSLADSPHTRYAQLGAWDAALMRLDADYGVLDADHLLVTHCGKGDGAPGDRAIVAERGPLVWVFNLSPHDTLVDFKIGVPSGGDWVAIADSDAVAYGGGGVLRPGLTHASKPEGTPGDRASNFNDRAWSIVVTAPPRSVQVYKAVG